jgi:hypothetical protein
MFPSYLDDGNFIGNDSHAFTSPHTTAHGNWTTNGENSYLATYYWLNVTDSTTVSPSGFTGAIKAIFETAINPANPDLMTGVVHLFFFPPGTDPLDPAGTGGFDVGFFDVVELRRIKAERPIVGAASRQRAVVVATVTRDGVPEEGLEVAFSRSISGRSSDYQWTGTTDADGRVTVDIQVEGRSGASGYYLVQATDAALEVVARWNSVPISGGRETLLSLPVGDRAVVVGRIPLRGVESFVISGNYPNPFNPATQIAYQILEPGDVSLTIYNLLGQEVRTLVRGYVQPGQYQVVWDGKDNLGQPVSSGVYVYRLAGKQLSQTRRMLLLK